MGSASKWLETMCFQSDPSSSLALYALKDLQDAGRLKIGSIQKAWLLGMEGAKGKQTFGRGANTAYPAFARTATHVFRMVMLEACGVDPKHWPSGGETSYRNEDKMCYEQVLGPKYVMAYSYEHGREFWAEFDKLYPHYIIEKYLEEGTGSLNRMMIVFKNYMQEVVEISMNVCAEHKGKNVIKCCVSATVVHRHIDLQGAEGKWLNRLALMVQGTRCPLDKHFDLMLDMDTSTMGEAQLVDAFNSLYHALPSKTAEIDDTPDCRGSSQPHDNKPPSTRLGTKFSQELGTNERSRPDSHNSQPPRPNKQNKVRSETVITTTNTRTVTKDDQVAEETNKVEKRELVVNVDDSGSDTEFTTGGRQRDSSPPPQKSVVIVSDKQ